MRLSMTTCSFQNLAVKCASVSLLVVSLLPNMHILAVPASEETNLAPGKYKTIQEAIDHSNPGDIVLIATGTYQERIRLRKGITVRRGIDES